MSTDPNTVVSVIFAIFLNWVIGDRIESIRAMVKQRAVEQFVALSDCRFVCSERGADNE